MRNFISIYAFEYFLSIVFYPYLHFRCIPYFHLTSLPDPALHLKLSTAHSSTWISQRYFEPNIYITKFLIPPQTSYFLFFSSINLLLIQAEILVLLLPVICQGLSTIPRAAILKLKHTWESPGGLVKTPSDEPYPQSSLLSRSERVPRTCISKKSPIDADASNTMTLWKYCSSESHISFYCLFPHVDYFSELLFDFLIGSLFFLAYLKKPSQTS